jgi:NTP pyrophosphatase (non-canonical NTP hydrolase)
MDASEYQKLAARTLIDRPDFDISDDGIMQVWNAIGLAGEAGEVADHIKKGVFHRHGVDREKLAKELGDVLWYAAALCTKVGLDMGEVMQGNIDKLRKRYPDGYSSEDSKRRVDVNEQPAPRSTYVQGLDEHLKNLPPGNTDNNPY